MNFFVGVEGGRGSWREGERGEKKGREKAITRKRIPVFTPHENQMGTSIYIKRIIIK